MMKATPTYNDQPLAEFFSTVRGFPKAVSDIAVKLQSATDAVPLITYFEQFGDSTVVSVVEETNPREIWLHIISTCLSIYGHAFSAYYAQVSDLRSSLTQALPVDNDRTLFDEYVDADILIICDDRTDIAAKADPTDERILNRLILKRTCSVGTVTLLVGDHWKRCKPYESYRAALELKRGLKSK